MGRRSAANPDLRHEMPESPDFGAGDTSPVYVIILQSLIQYATCINDGSYHASGR